MAKTLEIAGSELPGRSAVHRPASGTLQWRKVAHQRLVVLVCAILLLDLGLLGMHVTGYRLFPTLGDSMEPASSAGSLLITRLTAPEDIRVSDFIVFPESSQTPPFTAHRVAAVAKDGERRVAVTKGDNNPVFDPEPVTLDRPVARVVLVIPRVGWFVTLETAWSVWVIIALLWLTIAFPWAERRTTMVLTSHLRSDRWTRWLAEKKIGVALSLKGNLIRGLLNHRLVCGERGGVAIIMLLGFIMLGVPLTIAAIETSTVLSLASRVYDSRLTSMYSAGAGIEVALWEIMNDPDFDDDLSEQSPTKDITVENDGDTVLVTVTKIYNDATLQGQGVVVSKTVSPAAAAVNATTTFTYDITLKNEGTDTITVKKIYEYLPPGFTYASSTTSGPTTNDPDVELASGADCGSVPRKLTWNVPAQSETLASSEEMTLTFQATAALPDGTYYNQAASLYDPWWVASDVLVYTPYMAEVTVGTGAPKCGYGMKALVDHAVEPENPPVGVETEFTYTITFENTSAADIYVCQIKDLLPPTFTYVTSSSGDPLYSDNVDTSEPTLTWESTPERWDLAWEDISQSKFVPLATTTPGETRTQKFRANAIPESGVNYYNEVDILWATALTGQGKCSTNQGETGTAFSGTGNATYVDPPTLYDIQAIAPDGTIETRIIFYQLDGEIEVVSWQEY